MKNTVRGLTFAALLTASLATVAAAQVDAPAARSNTAGFNLGLFLNGSAVQLDGSDDVESGGGFGLQLGYGFTRHVSAFARVNAASLETLSDDEDSYALAHVDLGLRYSFGGSGSALRSFVQGAASGRAIANDDGDGIRGAGFSAGAGLEYFVSRKVAIEGGLSLSFGKFSEFQDGGGWQELEDGGVKATSSRFDIGISWHP